ncbi:MAG: hypothetical protein M0Q91_03525 [Methanoregula sp.]|nr:hypothetical protein [Methanoregula sp.]
MKLLKSGLLAVLFAMIIIIPVTGAQNIGVFRDSTHIYFEDYNGNGLWEGAVIDRSYDFGITGDLPVSGDWNNDGRTEIGVFRPSTHLFYLDYNGDGASSGPVIDRVYDYGITGDLPVSGDWNSDGRTEIGVFRPSTHLFYLDYNGDGASSGPVIDRVYNYGITGDLPVSGDWNGDGISEIGVFRSSTHLFYLDSNGDGASSGPVIDRVYNFGITGDLPVSGDWNDDGRTEIGVFRPSTHSFYLDYNGNGAWNGEGTDRAYNFGLTGDSPVSGKWYDLKFSMTNIETFNTLPSLSPYGTTSHTDIYNWLTGTPKWTQMFYETGANVEDSGLQLRGAVLITRLSITISVTEIMLTSAGHGRELSSMQIIRIPTSQKMKCIRNGEPAFTLPTNG